MTAKSLSIRDVESAQPQSKAYRLHDSKVPGLSLRVLPSGVKSWNVTWARNRDLAIGKWPIVTIDAARTKARAKLAEVDQHGAPVSITGGAALVADVCRDYVAALNREGRASAATDADRRFSRTVYADPIGKIQASKLTQKHLEAWRDRLESGQFGKLPAKKGRPPTAKPLTRGAFNRTYTPLKAALNRAVARRELPPDRTIEWGSVKPYKNADSRRDLYLDREQRRALLANASPDVRDMMECIALTGCRPGDPAALLRRDYDSRTASITFRTKAHGRTIPVSPAAKVLLDRLAKAKLPNAHMFTNGGAPWQPHDWRALVKDAAAAAELPDGVVLYTLRHCWITDAIIGGMDLLTVAKLTGTSLAMIEKHYGHLVQGAARDKLAEVSFL